MSEYTIVGAGVIGLYTAYQLLNELGITGEKITVLSEFLPGDQSINYTSPWAGGNFSCISPDDDDTQSYEKYSYQNLKKVKETLGGVEAGIDKRSVTEYWDIMPSDKKVEHLMSTLDDFKIIPTSQLPDGALLGVKYTTWNFNCPLFLTSLAEYLKSKGVTFQRRKLNHIAQAYEYKTKVVFNCTGIGARFIGGVEDKHVYPTRGQVVVIKAPHIKENRMRWGKGYDTYIIPRPHSFGEVVLGGFLQKGNWTGDTFGYESEDILKRTTELYPEIKDKPIQIIRVAAGLRPSRHGGARIELEKGDAGKVLVHNYGASGYGYQAGLGMSHRAVQLFQKYQAGKFTKL